MSTLQQCENVLQIRERSYVELHDLRKFANILTFGEDPRIVGTAALNIKYISDVDIFDQYNLHLSREESLRVYVGMIQNVAKRIFLAGRHGDVIFSEFKIGLDKRFLTTNDVVEFMKRNSALISDEMRRKLNTTQGSNELVHQLSTLRWTLKEIFRGYKTHLGKQISLIDALQDPTVMKCDIIIFHRGLYYEMSCVYYLMHNRDPFFPMLPYLESIKRDIKHFHTIGNVYKVIKRLWIYERLQQASCEILARLGNFLNSSTNALGAAVSGLNTLDLVIRKTHLSSPEIISRVKESLLFLQKMVWNNIQQSSMELFISKFNILMTVMNNERLFLEESKKLQNSLYEFVHANSREFWKELRENGYV